MDPDLEKRIGLVAANRESGASEIVVEAIAILRDAIARHANLPDVAQALRRAQPSMAPVWNATEAGLRGDLDRFAQRVARAPDAIARFASELLEIGAAPEEPLRIVTLSYSGTVAYVLEGLARRRSVHVACSEGRPAMEGRAFAVRLASAGIRVSHYTDAALGVALGSSHAVLVGADAVAAAWFLNKSGTHMLAALAAGRGVPVYVAAGREKFVSAPAAAHLTLRDGAPAEVWSDPPPGTVVLNPYFERIPLEAASAVITDIGVLSSSDVDALCGSTD